MALTQPYQGNHGGVRPLAKIAGGLAVVYCGFRINNFDLLLNPVGWALCASALDRLRGPVGEPFDRARAVALLMVCVSAIDQLAVLNAGDLEPTAAVQVIGYTDNLGGITAVWLIADAVVRRLRADGHGSRAAVVDVLRWIVTALSVLGTMAGLGYAALGPALAVVWFISLAALVVILYGSADLITAPPRSEDVPARSEDKPEPAAPPSDGRATST